MAIGKNKKMGKKGAKKKAVDPFTRKEWYDVVAPAVFHKRHVGKTVVNRTQGTRTAEDSLKGRVFEVSLGDLGSSPEVEFRKFRLICEDVQKNRCLTNFHGMDFTRDKLCAIVRKWHTLVEANAKVKTTDGYLLRVFCTGFSRRAPAQVKKTTYIKKSKVKAIRAKMVEIMVNEVSSSDLRDLCKKLIPDTIGKDIEKACARIYPMQDVYVRKVKVLKKPKYDIHRLLSMHTDEEGAVATTDEATGERVWRYAVYEPPVQESV